MMSVSLGQFLRLQDEFTAQAEAGTLTESRLSELARTKVRDNDGPETSAGMHWIAKHPQLFAQVVRNPFAFLIEHLGIDADIGEVVVVVPGILALLDDRRRRAYIEVACVRRRPCNNGWINAALEVGIDREFLREVIMLRLHIAQPAEHSLGALMYDAFVAFLLDGHKAIASNQPGWSAWNEGGTSPWDLFDADSFEEVVAFCAERSPVSIIVGQRQLLTRLPVDRVNALVTQAASRLSSLAGIAGSANELLPTVQLDLARRISSEEYETHHCAKFLFTMLLAQPPEGIPGLFREFVPKIESLSEPAVAYRIAFICMRYPCYAVAAEVLRPVVVNHLLAIGCIGTVKEGSYRGRRQLEVRVGNVTYVRARNAHRHSPEPGEVVIFDPSESWPLGPRVRAVHFYPTDGRSIEFGE